MAIRDRIAKALNLPTGSVTQTEQQIANASLQSGTRAEPLPRDPDLASIPFSPQVPLVPGLINPPREDGRATPRISQFPVAWNLQIVEQRVVPFHVLREVADQADIVRKCIEVVKNAITGMKWDVAMSPDAVERIMADNRVSHQEAAVIARDLFTGEISRVKDFWHMPDRVNGLSFAEWINMALEEVLVIDALSIYPNKTLDNKELHSLEILDGSTIKPLLDQRGARPQAPNPAFQQILWGFPRGEFTYSPDGVTDEFTEDNLVYVPRNRRTYTPYGYSAVERSLPLVDLYMKRIQWLRTEFTDGVVPDMVILSDANFGNNPELLRGYETVFNDSLAGNLEQRRRARVMPAGMTPMFTAGWDTKYKADFDEWLVKAICGHFGVLPTQLGFTPKSGLGGKGHQDGEANSAETIGLRPIIMWLTNLVNDLSYKFLGMPRDLAFSFTDGTEGDLMAQAMRRKVEIETGVTTLNEARAEMGKPLFTFPEADVPVIVAGANVIPLNTYTPLQPADANGTTVPGQEPTDTRTGNEPASGPARQAEAQKPPATDAQVKELQAFKRWAKNPKGREFVFTTIDEDMAKTLNVLVHQDVEAARDMADIVKAGGNPKAGGGMEPLPPHHPAKDRAEQLRRKYRKRFLSVGLNTEQLAREWHDAPSPDPTGWLAARGVSFLGAGAVAALVDLYYESAYLGGRSADAVVNAKKEGRPRQATPPVDWQGWTPGNPDKARELLGDTFYPSLDRLVAQAPDVIDGINHTRLTQFAAILGAAIAAGLTASETQKQLDQVLGAVDRSELAANTEMMLALNGAGLDVYQAAGVEMVNWVSSGDANVCEDCLDLEANGPYPVDAVPEDPPLHPNCGCVLEPADTTIELAMRPDVFKVHRQMVTDALAKLAKIPDVKDGLIAVPWDIKERPKVPKHQWRQSELESFKIEKLYATQKYLKRVNVEWHLKHPGESHEGQNAYPNILQHDGDNLIYDGHHRLAALWLLGARRANCWTLETDNG